MSRGGIRPGGRFGDLLALARGGENGCFRLLLAGFEI